ncbi:MAG: HEAT repeat domain-containing protein [Acidobacteria bacterium]|nr:HEAT repeat domain-containing protein [Acidobacteriota bacterium]
MSEAVQLSPEQTRTVGAVARALLSAARTWSLYPPEHPAVGASLDRLTGALGEATMPGALMLGVTPDALLINGVSATSSDGLAEAARFLHDRDIVELSFAADVPHASVASLLRLLRLDGETLRERGGPATIWAEHGDPHIGVEQIDYKEVLEDHASVVRKDDVWYAIVRTILDRKKTFDEEAQQRLLEIVGNIDAIRALASDVMAPNCAADGSPMIAAQAAAVLAAYRQLANVISVLAPERFEEILRNLADATTGMNEGVVIEMLRAEDREDDGTLLRQIAATFDEEKVAQLLATVLAMQGQASVRLADVFETLAPDEERRTRLLTQTRSALAAQLSADGDRFSAIWRSVEELLVTYDDRRFVSGAYRGQLDGVAARAETMAAGEMPEELDDWLQTIAQDNVRRLSVTLMIDLLRSERDEGSVSEIATELGALTEDLLLAGDLETANKVGRLLSRRAGSDHALGHQACRGVLDGLARSAALAELFDCLADLDAGQFALLKGLCGHIGPLTIESLRNRLLVEEARPERVRATEIILTFGAVALTHVAPLVRHPDWFVRRNIAELLGAIGSPEAVPLLQPLLRGEDPRVIGPVFRAIANIDDPSAARAVQIVLRTATGEQRKAVVAVLMAERDPRVVPFLLRLLAASRPFGADHEIVLETLEALQVVGTDQAVGTLVKLMRRNRWFAFKKSRAIKQAVVATLIKINTPKAMAAVQEASRRGDRRLRRAAAAAMEAVAHA